MNNLKQTPVGRIDALNLLWRAHACLTISKTVMTDVEEQGDCSDKLRRVTLLMQMVIQELESMSAEPWQELCDALGDTVSNLKEQKSAVEQVAVATIDFKCSTLDTRRNTK